MPNRKEKSFISPKDAVWKRFFIPHLIVAGYYLGSNFKAEVIKVLRILDYMGNLQYVAVYYWDAGNTAYECVSLNRVKGFCDAEKNE